jgi:hypothetical protein
MRTLQLSKFIKIFVTTAIVIAAGFSFGSAEAASLYLSPSSSRVTAGNIISVKVSVNTEGAAVNASSATIQYPADLLDVVSVSKGSSIFSLWVEEPRFSSQTGTITFDGGLPNPGYVGQSGEIVSIAFRAKSTGLASIFFGDSAVRANDGLGTDVLKTKLPASVDIRNPEPINDQPSTPIASGLRAPVVVSTTHPDQNKWYAVDEANFKWEVPDGVTAVSTSLTKIPATPTVVYDPPIGNRDVSGIGDGAWYFNVRFKNANGWGAVAHYKVQVDTVAPRPFKISFQGGETVDSPNPALNFKATDATSGVGSYALKIDDSGFTKVSPGDLLPSQDPGKHTVFIKAIDYAGNETIQSADFTILPIQAPEITEFPSEISKGELVRIRGNSALLTNVEVVLEDSSGKRETQTTATLEDGTFRMVWSKELSTGSYTITARAIDRRDAKSNFTKPVTVTVKQSAFVNISSAILNWLSLIIIILAFIGGIGWVITRLLLKNIAMKKTIRKEVHATELAIHRAFELLRENVRDQIKLLEKARTKRALTKEEEKIIRQLEANLNESERYLEKEVAQIEEKLN